MPVPVYLPKFDPQHVESRILSWLASEGDAVLEGDPICEVETDKVNMEVEAPASGALAGVVFAEGQTAPAATVIAYVLLAGETQADLPPAPDKHAADLASRVVETPPEPAISPVARRMAEAENLDLRSVSGSGPGGRIVKRDLEPLNGGRVRATPAARRLARANGIDPGSIQGSGPRGRVQAADILKAGDAVADAGDRRFRLTGVRARIAENMTASYQTAPHIVVETRADMTQIEALRREVKATGENLSMTAALIRVCAWALKRHPRLNATIDGDVVTEHTAVHIGFAAALDGGLVAPVIHGADGLTLSMTAARLRDLSNRARNGTLQPADLRGGTFTISNLGMFGVSRFTAIINPPQVAILAVGQAIREFVPDENDQPRIRPMATLALSVDHRVVDGADAARFLQDLRGALERPSILLWDS